MSFPRFDAATTEKIERILGYLNFSSGAEDSTFLANLNDLFGLAVQIDRAAPGYQVVHKMLVQQLDEAEKHNPTFADSRQAKRVIELVFEHVLPGYIIHHRDLLFHRTGESLFNAFFVGRVFEVALQMPDDWSHQRGVADIIGKLNDYIGHRPVAALESQKLEPYEHEWVRPKPLYVRNAGAVHGPYREVVQSAIKLLTETDPELLDDAQFDPQLMDELAVDPRSFDFEHPVNKRPNHHFGQWDEHHIDRQGNYRRFVVHQVTLDALTARIEQETELPREQMILEAGAVLAGTMLMAAGICGRGPGAHDSTVTLSSLLPIIARYRDQFYADLLNRVDQEHRSRLIEEAEKRQQPFGAARQHLNRQLARYRAFQMVHVHLALIYSRMGYDNAAIRHANILPVASARMLCQIDCLLYAGQQALDDEQLLLAAETMPRLFDLLQRGVDCGAVIDPWNILGFDANYNLFHGTENTVRDHRADELSALMEQIFCFASQVWIATEAADQSDISQKVKTYFNDIVQWWRKYAVHEVSSVDSVDAKEIFSATENVAKALNLWHKSGAASGDVEFWASHAKLFNSPRAYILTINSLIERNDYVTSMALLIHWLSQSEILPLQQSSGSFQALVGNWICRQRELLDHDFDVPQATETWRRVRKFCDYVEANAGDYWSVPHFELTRHGAPKDPDDSLLPGSAIEADDEDDLYRAAYEDMVYRETTDDGVDGSIYETPVGQSEEDIQAELSRIGERIEFLDALAHYWIESTLLINQIVEELADCQALRQLVVEQKQKVEDWTGQANKNCDDLARLVASIQIFQLPDPDGSIDSLVQYDRQRLFKETMLDQAIQLNVVTANAARLLDALSLTINRALSDDDSEQIRPNPGESTVSDSVASQCENQLWSETLSAVLSRDTAAIQQHFPKLLAELATQPLLYIPLSKAGEPLQIVNTRVRQCSIGQLLESFPRLGLLIETRELIHAALMMERNQKVRQGAVTEFDELFRVGYTAMVEALIDASNEMELTEKSTEHDKGERSNSPKTSKPDRKSDGDTALFDCLEMLAESMLMLWLSHSQTLRLSVLEKVRDEQNWQQLVDFIQRFGDQLLTQQFLNLSNIRAILHQGVDRWLTALEEEPAIGLNLNIIEEIKNGYPRKDAVRFLTLILEAIIENFNEYRDYNCTTTQSDDGKLLYILLEFLRLRCRYDQVAWNLRPVVWAHESLVRNGQTSVARLWRRLLTERVTNEADKFQELHHELQEEYSIQMATVGQRIGERFVHPMHVDRIISLVRPAMKDPRSKSSRRDFEMIEHHAETLTQQPIGVGFELPGWLTALDQEVEAVLSSRFELEYETQNSLVKPMLPSLNELKDQLQRMPRRE